MTIPVGSRIALVGQTGSGKSTIDHLLLGLLKAEMGELELDGNPLTPEELPALQASCAQVPQMILLLDASVRANVAFGIDEPPSMKTRFGRLSNQLSWLSMWLICLWLATPRENGHQLSGGQRQRLALRAFYRNASVLVLDEATSAWTTALRVK